MLKEILIIDKSGKEGKMWIRKHRLLAEAMVVFALVCFTAPGFAADPFAGRILPTQKVSFFTDGQKVAQYTAEAPLPWDTLVKCEGRAGVRINKMALVFEDGSSFMISRTEIGNILNIKSGTAYFAFASLPEGLTFVAPQGFVAPEFMMLNASTGNQMLKGYVKVDKSASELGILEGGKLTVRTADGNHTINTGQRLILAQATLAGGGTAGTGGGVGFSTGTIVAMSAVGASLLAVTALGINEMNKDEGSPFTPPQ